MMSQIKRWLFFIRIQWPLILAALLVVAAFWVTLQFVEPPPPKEITLAAGPRGGGYDYFARRYAEALAKEGIQVKIRETRGSLDNIRLLNDPESGVDIAFAQGGTGWAAGVYQNDPEESNVQSLGEIYLEPLWVFTPRNKAFEVLSELKGKKLAVGISGSGAYALTVDLLKWSGVHPENATFLELTQEEALRALREGRVDAAFFVGGPGSPFLKGCAADPVLRLHSFQDGEAYARRFSYLSSVKLPRSVLDLEKNVPGRDIMLVAPPATLLVNEEFHPALVSLLLSTARKIHGGHGILSNAGDFPAVRNLEFPQHAAAARYFSSGPSLLQRYLPYHLAAFIDRTKILLLPLLTLLLPLFKIAYPTYRWSVRRNVWKWYKVVEAIQKDYTLKRQDKDKLLERLRELEEKVARVHVPFAYASELYTLRHHLVMVRKMIKNNEAAPPSAL